jgi:excisionase family DNA binding protein
MSSPNVLPIRQSRRPRPAGELLSLTQVCQRLGVPEIYVYAIAHRGHLRTVMVGRRQKYLSWEVDALLKTGDFKARIFNNAYLNWIRGQYETVVVHAA